MFSGAREIARQEESCHKISTSTFKVLIESIEAFYIVCMHTRCKNSIHGNWYIYLHEWLIFVVFICFHVGKFTVRLMDFMGLTSLKLTVRP